MKLLNFGIQIDRYKWLNNNYVIIYIRRKPSYRNIQFCFINAFIF